MFKMAFFMLFSNTRMSSPAYSMGVVFTTSSAYIENNYAEMQLCLCKEEKTYHLSPLVFVSLNFIHLSYIVTKVESSIYVDTNRLSNP